MEENIQERRPRIEAVSFFAERTSSANGERNHSAIMKDYIRAVGSSALVRRIGRSFWMRYLLSKYQWYRRWYGGRWEYHWISVTTSAMWLEMQPGKCWPEYRQPCSMGTPIVEDWPNDEMTSPQIKGQNHG